jgi:transposase
MHITRGDSRDHRPDLHQVRRALRVEPQAGLPVLMNPLSGQSRDAHSCGQVIRAPLEPWQTTSGRTSLVAASAR